MAVADLNLCMFDLGVRLVSDSHSFLEFMDWMYARFRVTEFPPSLHQILEFHFYEQADNPWGKPVFVMDGEVSTVEDDINPFGYVYDSVLSAVLSKIRDYFIIHAGVVSKDGKAILLSADSGHGKTTLVLELVRRGFRFLSDELAPIHRKDHHVEPFPRSIRLRPGTLDLVGLPSAPEDTPLRFRKYILDIDQIMPGALNGPARIAAVIIMKDHVKPGESFSENRALRVFVNRLDADLLEAVAKIDGVSQLSHSRELGHPVLQFTATKRMQVLAQVEQVCQNMNILIFDVSKRPLTTPSFTGPAQLIPLPKSQAALDLIRQYQPAHKSALLQDVYQGSASRLYFELVGILANVDCYQLKPGPLRETADLIGNLDLR